MSKTKLKAVSRTQNNNRRVKEGAVTLPDFDLEFEEIPVLVQGFRRMVRQLAFDVCEMALTTYICAKAHGVKFTAIPIFLVRDFHHGAIAHHVPSGLKSPAELAGKRVGVNRGYTVTTGVWARAIIQDEYDVDLSSITWAPSGDEHVEAYRAPENVVPLPDGDLEAHLASGDVVAAVGASFDHPDIAEMIPNEFEAGVAALKSRGFYPINHTVVVRDAVLEEMPDVAIQVFDAFAESKRQYVADLKAGRITDPKRVDRVHKVALEVMDDPLPYGVEPNRKTLEGLVDHAATQKIIPQRMALEDLFAKSVLDAVG
ncbi:MAG: ABC transporter substrate-binding protein [Alphaproteobacteria bacterium]|nr:ABC transporter substrate-binding protein [Alphaproteobacteria bacterium]